MLAAFTRVGVSRDDITNLVHTTRFGPQRLEFLYVSAWMSATVSPDFPRWQSIHVPVPAAGTGLEHFVLIAANSESPALLAAYEVSMPCSGQLPALFRI